MDSNPSMKWVMKAPFTTNKQHFYKYDICTPSAALRHINTVHRKLWGPIPECYEIEYLLLQERVKNNKEAKLCFFGGEFHHFTMGSAGNLKQSFPEYSSDDLIQFATLALQSVSRHPEYLLDGLVRVDLFFSENDQKLVVNEFESLEASFLTTKHDVQMKASAWLKRYWEKKIYTCISDVFSADY